MLKKFILSSLFVLLTLQVFAIKILHPGVKINSNKLTETMYMLTKDEIASFTSWKIKNDFYERELLRKETEIKIYKDFNKALMQKFTTISSSFMKTSDKMLEQVNARIKDRKAARRRLRRARTINLIKGVLYGIAYTGVSSFIK